MKISAAGLLALLGLLAPPVQASDVSLMPVNVQLDRFNDRATVQVMNNGAEPVIMQAEAIAWNRVGGVDHDAPTADIIVNPPVFTIKPGQTQIVRVGLRRTQELAQEGTYRMVLREVPGLNLANVGNVNGSVRVLVAMRVPIYVAPGKVQRGERWQLGQDGKGNLVATVSNTGNVHLKVGELRSQGPNGETMVLASQQGPAAVIFPGEARSFALKMPAGAQPPKLQALTDQGLQQVAFADADKP
ncbi:MAG: fimbria/pilus periplasmic chaperone [Burkholderiaceae bacterium]